MNTDMKKQTALQWLYAKLDQMPTRDEVCDLVYQLEEEAKAMEKEQIIDSYVECYMNHVGNGESILREANSVYTKTYGGDK